MNWAAAPRGDAHSSSPRSRGRLLVTAAVKVKKGKQVLCNKTLKAKQGDEAAVAELCRGVAEWSQGRIVDRSSGVLAYQFSEARGCMGGWENPWCRAQQALDGAGVLVAARPTGPPPLQPHAPLLLATPQDDYEPGTFHFMELYASQAAMAEHNGAEPVRRFVGQLAPHLDGPLGMVLYEYSDGKIGPPSMEGEVKGEGGLDDATGTNKFGGGASMKQTSAVVNLTSIREEDDEERGIWGLKGLNFKLPSWAGGKAAKK